MRILITIAAMLTCSVACTHQDSETTLRMDHSYQLTASADVYNGFASRGFILNPRSVGHPGQKTCQFLHFREADGFEPYLEFCFIDSRNPKDHYDVRQDPKGANPGFAWAADQNLEGLLATQKDAWEQFKPSFSHKNYDWAKDRDSRLPGWNYVNFDVEPVPGIFMWMNEYEKSPDRPQGKRSAAGLVEHPNSAQTIRGFLWSSITDSEKQNLVRITGGRLDGDRLVPKKGPWIQFLAANHPIALRFKDKETRYWAVVLNVGSLQTFNEQAKPTDWVDLDGQKAARIALGKNSWDILALPVLAETAR